MENKIKELENAATARTDAEINALLDAQPKGTFTDEERAKLKEIGVKAGVDALAVALKKTSAQPVAIADLIKSEGKHGADAGKNWKWYQDNDPSALEKMPESDPETFKQLYRAEYGVEPEV
ncbi:hypothetical protein SDC9_156349 [bioreactor metagenome]|uniref:Uncharacterized protein n=1 Tax=bioreactor metagenome TaxID=1076179 RepID=A0A645F467_9ZZZZ